MSRTAQPLGPVSDAVSDPLNASNASNDDLENGITRLAAYICACEYRLLELIREFDKRGAWGGVGIQSMAHWLNWKCGMSLGTAHERVRVAHALAGLPAIAASFAQGEISYSKVRAMTRVANADNERALLDMAHHATAAQVEKLVRHTRRAQRLGLANHAYAMRSLRWDHEDDGSISFQIRLPVEMAEVLIHAIEQARVVMEPSALPTPGDNQAPSLEPDEDVAARRADALAAVAEAQLAHRLRAGSGDVWQLVVHQRPAADAAAAADADAAGGADAAAALPAAAEEPAELERSGPIAGETAERIACDAAIVDMAEDADGNVLDVGRKRRAVPPAMRRALQRRDGGCRFPGCTNHLFVDAHHIEHWSHGGATCLDNILLLCRRHHRLVHEGGWHIVRGSGPLLAPVHTGEDSGVTFVRPDGEVQDGAFPLKAWLASPAGQSDRAWRLGPGAVPESSAENYLNLWDGGPMDYNTAIDGLLGRAKPPEFRDRGGAGRPAAGPSR